MSDTNLKEDIRKATYNHKKPFNSIVLILISFLHGLFILRFKGYLITHSSGGIGLTTENIVGVGLLVFSILKIIAMIYENKWLRKISIVALSSIWTGLFIISLVYAFGLGSPSPYWYFHLAIVLSCYRVSFQGGD